MYFNFLVLCKPVILLLLSRKTYHHYK
ncbi:BnaCnng18560D [Brassica napus]|uniref:BnaCnng18560D protein n=1 Tax=Brassica napus TaxID=3708 RepID=A0A078IJ03_BRANA|nr:BnaCnng18560D [Brassica napus]